MDTTVLEDIGLSQREIKIYLALLEEGPHSAGRIIDKANVQNSVFHFCINRLIGKGLVAYIRKGKVRVYSASQPDQFLTYLRDKEEKVAELLPALKARQNLAKEAQDAELFEGIKGVRTALLEMLNDAKKGDDYLFFTLDIGDEEQEEEIHNFYRWYNEVRSKKKLNVKGIVPSRFRHIYEGRKGVTLRFTDLPMPANQGICNDNICMISWEKKPVAVLIRSKQLVDAQRRFFNAFWDMIG